MPLLPASAPDRTNRPGTRLLLLDIMKTTLRGAWELPGTKALLKPLHKFGVR
ncbi:hypothetical protein DPMN_160572 [Dreissena polymorpha]|uniref:Uncharacterized protein n=1 Tax=Dreissena polymorpha TaxID=45954 RepID=A0A9D4ENQ9_DREPO|nr:hypothetical protein DPMN_160572 [Dreissena polymorpha]